MALLTNPLSRDAGPSGKTAMLTVVCGNSIAVISKVSSGTFLVASDIQHANYLAGSPMRFALMTATTRSDAYGTYGYSGQTLPTIVADLSTQWHDQIAGAGVRPELVVGHSLLENDVAAGATVAAMAANLTSWIRLVRVWWPGCVILLLTPRPSLSNNTPTLVANFQAITAYMLSLDNGADIFVCQMNAYESAALPGTPIVGNVTGSRSGTALTVSTTDVVLGVGDTLVTDAANACKITAYGTGTGGAGTYTVSVTGSPSTTTWTVAQHTDMTVHPTARGAMANARKIAQTFARIGAGAWVQPCVGAISTGTLGILAGTAAASGTNVSGTVPTGCSLSGSANGTFVSTALQPGWEITVNNNAQGYKTDLSTFTHSTMTQIANAALVSPFCVVQIVSGAANLSHLQFTPRQWYGTAGGSNGFAGGILMQTSDQDGVYQDGDILTMVCQPIAPPSGGFTQVTNYFRATLAFRAGTGAVTLRILETGVLVPEGKVQAQITAPAAAGTATLDASLGQSVQVIMPAGNITIAAPLNPQPRQRLDIAIKQDGVGSRTITWNAAFKKSADGAGGANAVGATSFIYDGTNWAQIGGALAFA